MYIFDVHFDVYLGDKAKLFSKMNSNVYLHLYCLRDPNALHPGQHLVLSAFLIYIVPYYEGGILTLQKAIIVLFFY